MDLGQEVKNILNPSFEVLLFRGHGLGRRFVKPARVWRRPERKSMRCTPHDLSKDLFGTLPRALSSKCDLRGVHHANGTPSFDNKLVFNVLEVPFVW